MTANSPIVEDDLYEREGLMIVNQVSAICKLLNVDRSAFLYPFYNWITREPFGTLKGLRLCLFRCSAGLPLPWDEADDS